MSMSTDVLTNSLAVLTFAVIDFLPLIFQIEDPFQKTQRFVV